MVKNSGDKCIIALNIWVLLPWCQLYMRSDCLEHINIRGRIILKWFVQRQYVRLWTGLSHIMIQSKVSL
jgi:hypothetical protein